MTSAYVFGDNAQWSFARATLWQKSVTSLLGEPLSSKGCRWQGALSNRSGDPTVPLSQSFPESPSPNTSRGTHSYNTTWLSTTWHNRAEQVSSLRMGTRPGCCAANHKQVNLQTKPILQAWCSKGVEQNLADCFFDGLRAVAPRIAGVFWKALTLAAIPQEREAARSTPCTGSLRARTADAGPAGP